MTVDDHAAARIWHGQQAGAIAAADVPDLDTAWKHIDAADAHLTAERAHRYELVVTDLAAVCSHAWQTSFNLTDTGADPMNFHRQPPEPTPAEEARAERRATCRHSFVAYSPVDDDPTCRTCGIPMNDPDALEDEETCACDMRHPDDDTPFTHHPHCIIGHATTGSYHGRGPGR